MVGNEGNKETLLRRTKGFVKDLYATCYGHHRHGSRQEQRTTFSKTLTALLVDSRETVGTEGCRYQDFHVSTPSRPLSFQGFNVTEAQWRYSGVYGATPPPPLVSLVRFINVRVEYLVT